MSRSSAAAVALMVVVALAATATATVAQVTPPPIDYWTSAIPAAGSTFPQRYNFQPVIDGSNRLFVIGGGSNVGLNDVWMSVDGGAAWTCQSCLAMAELFPPRFKHAITTTGNTLVVAAGMSITDSGQTAYYNDVWISSSAGVQWELVPTASPWAGSDSVKLVAGTQSNLFFITGIASDAGSNVWQLTAASKYKTWVDRGPVTIGGSKRRNFGLSVAKDNVLFLAGGYGQDPLAPTQVLDYQDVWMADLSSAATTIQWTQLTAAAPWTPRTPSLNFDSKGNLYVFGQFSTGAATAPDLMWVSPAASRGVTWERVDGLDCTGTWPFPQLADPGDFLTLVDTSDRMYIVGANPSGTTATSIIQLYATDLTDNVNLAQNKVPWTTCTSSSSSTGSAIEPVEKAKHGLSDGATAAVVVILLVVFIAVVAAFAYRRWKRTRFSDITTAEQERDPESHGYSGHGARGGFSAL